MSTVTYSAGELNFRGIMQNQNKPFAPYHPWDRAFFLTNAIVAWVAILAGFGPELYQHGRGVSPFPPLLVLVHGGVFFGWLALFLLHVWLIRSRRVNIHRKLGMAATVMVPLMDWMRMWWPSAFISRRGNRS